MSKKIRVQLKGRATSVSPHSETEMEDSGIRFVVDTYCPPGDLIRDITVVEIDPQELVQNLATEKDVTLLLGCCQAEERIRFEESGNGGVHNRHPLSLRQLPIEPQKKTPREDLSHG